MKHTKKNARTDKEYTREQRLYAENKQLKQAIHVLAKQIERLQAGKKLGKDEAIVTTPIPETHNSKGKVEGRLCHKCPDGKFQIVRYERAGEEWYFRKCNACSHRTRGKRFDDTVVE